MENCQIHDKLSHLVANFSTDQIYFSYLCRELPSDYFCQIVFNSEHWFLRKRRLKFLIWVHMGNWP